MSSHFFRVALALLAGAAAAGAQSRLPAPVKDSTLVAYDDEGLRIHSADHRRQLKLRGYLAVDARAVLSDTSDAAANTFAIRRSRLVFDANINPWLAFRIMTDLVALGVPSINDAFVDVSFSKTIWMRFGKQKVPYGLERTIGISEQFFPERSISAQLTSNRDEGVLVTGEFGDGLWETSVGVFNGTPEGGVNGELDGNDAKDLTFRLVTHPVRRSGAQGITIGFNGTRGIARAFAGSTQLPRFISPALLPFFDYSAAARADGMRTRNGIFANAHFGQFGAVGELFSNEQRVTTGATSGQVKTSGWLGLADFVLTGEKSIQGGVAPAKLFDPEKRQWGALQAVARMAQVKVGDEAFPTFASLATSARTATELGVGLNWFFTRYTKAQVVYERTSFQGGAAAGADRKTEQIAMLRLQAYF